MESSNLKIEKQTWAHVGIDLAKPKFCPTCGNNNELDLNEREESWHCHGCHWQGSLKILARPAIMDAAEAAPLILKWHEVGPPKGISYGWSVLDPMVKVRRGEWTVLTGWPGHGKTTWLLAALMKMADASGWKFARFSPEVLAYEQETLCLLELFFGVPFEKLVEAEVRLGMIWIRKHFFYVDPPEKTFASLLASFKVVLPREKGHKYFVDHRNGELFIRTNKNAKNYRIVRTALDKPAPRHWKEVVKHDKAVLIGDVDVFQHFLVSREKTEALARVRVYDFKAKSWKTIKFDDPVYTVADARNDEFTATRYRLGYQSPVTPHTVLDVDMGSGERTVLKRQEVVGGFDPARYETKRLWAPARDGVKVPLWVVYKKGVKLDGSAPLLLYSYGSYGNPTEATFSIRNISLLERGVIYAQAHIRGGNDLGEGWHDDGMLMKKKNTFTDFIDSAEYLVKQQWTNPKKLIIQGGSAGGLLMGAVVNMRPDLFHAVHAAVPFVDVMNTMMDATLPLTTGEYLEWGNPNEKAAYDYMRSYSPYDNIERKAYPAMLVTTGLNDSQVMYWEPAKYVAKLRAHKTDSNELLLKTNMGAGHGGASGRFNAIQEGAFQMAWMLSQWGIKE